MRTTRMTSRTIRIMIHSWKGGREKGGRGVGVGGRREREEGREGLRGGREGKREGGKERGRERQREGKREGGKERGRERKCQVLSLCT